MTDRYAVFGNPIQQSLSPVIHTQFAEQCKQDIDYIKQLVEIGDFNKAAGTFFSSGGKGLNITAPFKEDAFEFSQQLSKRAKAAEAVNTLALQQDGTILGDNTDGVGLVWDICERLQWQIKNKRVLILGAGGAVKGVLLPLLEQNPECIHIANRTASRVEALKKQFALIDLALSEKLSYSDFSFEVLPSPFDIIINGTSASLSGSVPHIPSALVHSETCFYDLAYSKNPTPFMCWAQSLRAKQIVDGLGMLVGQAAESFYIWRGIKPEVSNVYKSLR